MLSIAPTVKELPHSGETNQLSGTVTKTRYKWDFKRNRTCPSKNPFLYNHLSILCPRLAIFSIFGFLQLFDFHEHIPEPRGYPENQESKQKPGLRAKPLVQEIPEGQTDKGTGHKMYTNKTGFSE